MGSGRRRYRGRGVTRHRVGMASHHSQPGFFGRHYGKIGIATALGLAGLAHKLGVRVPPPRLPRFPRAPRRRVEPPLVELPGAPQQGNGRHGRRRMTNLPMAY